MAEQNYPVGIHLVAETEDRNRLTTAFRFFLSIPHLLLVGGPGAVAGWVSWHSQHGSGWGSSGGLIGAFAVIAAVIAWAIILFTGSNPGGLWRFIAYYLRWRVRAMAYLMLLRDEYPPFGADDYPAQLVLGDAPASRDRLTVFLRLLLALPHLIAVALLGILWAFTTAVAWVLILVTGRYPETLYGFALGVLAWSVRVEAYVLLLRDEYPPFSLRV